MTSRTFWIAKILVIGVSLAAAFAVDQSVVPRSQFVATPFAIPVIVTAWWFSSRGVVAAFIVSLALAAYSAHIDRAPLIPALLHLASLLIVSILILMLGQQRRATARRARDAENARREVEFERARLRAIFEGAINAIVYVDARTGQVMGNAEAVRLFGHPFVREAGRAQYAGQVLRPDGEPVPLADLLSTHALKGESPAREEALVVRPDGSRVPILVNAAPIRLPDGTVSGVVVVFQDISALKEAERLREEWTSLVAHDLRQPVTVINGYAALLAKHLDQYPPLASASVGAILNSVHQLSRMIGDLLDVSRIESRRLTLARRTVDLPSLVESVVARTAQVTAGHPVRVEVAGTIPPLEIDPDRIEQVLGNLLSNAAKYSAPMSEIVVSAKRTDDATEVSVINSGPGIPPEEMPRLFTRFYRTPRSQASRVGGLGLGLYISRSLIEAHGGRIWAESTPGQTTTFSFTLPLTGSFTRR